MISRPFASPQENTQSQADTNTLAAQREQPVVVMMMMLMMSDSEAAKPVTTNPKMGERNVNRRAREKVYPDDWLTIWSWQPGFQSPTEFLSFHSTRDLLALCTITIIVIIIGSISDDVVIRPMSLNHPVWEPVLATIPHSRNSCAGPTARERASTLPLFWRFVMNITSITAVAHSSNNVTHTDHPYCIIHPPIPLKMTTTTRNARHGLDCVEVDDRRGPYRGSPKTEGATDIVDRYALVVIIFYGLPPYLLYIAEVVYQVMCGQIVTENCWFARIVRFNKHRQRYEIRFPGWKEN